MYTLLCSEESRIKHNLSTDGIQENLQVKLLQCQAQYQEIVKLKDYKNARWYLKIKARICHCKIKLLQDFKSLRLQDYNI